jgi:endonuclease/exonuclease/phosphatase family metal-dependent hydrolase
MFDNRWALLVVVALPACGERPLTPRDPTPGVPHFTIATYNVEDIRSSDPETVAAVGEIGANILCLQEVTDDWAKVLRQTYSARYPYMLYRPGGADGLGILSEYPLEDLDYILAANGGWHPAWRVRAQTPAGWLQLLDVHLRNGTSGNGGQLHSLLTVAGDHRSEIERFTDESVHGLPTMIMGDFNEGVDGAAVDFLKTQGFQDALSLYHPGQFTWRYDSFANEFTQALDHLMFDAAVEPLNSWVVIAGNSDHIPVVGSFEASYVW